MLYEKHVANNEATPTHVEKAGIGMKVTRALWDRYPEPTFWEVTRTKVAKRASPRAWGVLTFRGKREDKERKIRCTRKETWREIQ